MNDKTRPGTTAARIVDILRGADAPMPARMIADSLGDVGYSTVTENLGKLAGVGAVTATKVGSRKLYAVAAENADAVTSTDTNDHVGQADDPATVNAFGDPTPNLRVGVDPGETTGVAVVDLGADDPDASYRLDESNPAFADDTDPATDPVTIQYGDGSEVTTGRGAPSDPTPRDPWEGLPVAAEATAPDAPWDEGPPRANRPAESDAAGSDLDGPTQGPTAPVSASVGDVAGFLRASRPLAPAEESATPDPSTRHRAKVTPDNVETCAVCGKPVTTAGGKLKHARPKTERPEGATTRAHNPNGHKAGELRDRVLELLRTFNKANLAAVDADGYSPADVAKALNEADADRTVQAASAHYACKLLATRGEAIEVSKQPARYRAA